MSQSRKTIEVIGVPSDLGANIRGACMGPAAVRIAGLQAKIEELGYTYLDSGDIKVPIREEISKDDRENKHLDQIAAICQDLHQTTKNSLEKGNLPIIVGGDHSIAIGTISGVSDYLHAKNEKMGLIWIDAHADVNTPDSSPSGNIHGMPLATVLGQGHPILVNMGQNKIRVAPENVALIGIRMIDDTERKILKSSGIRYFTMRDIDERGMPTVMKEAVAVASQGTSGIHLSFDIDGVDPIFAPGVSTPVAGGLSFREAHLALEVAHESGRVISLEFVEVNPSTDLSSSTAKLCVDLIQSALGKAIL